MMQERLFRKLYGKVRKINSSLIDFDMNVKLPEFKCKGTTFSNCLWSSTEKWFYIPLLIVTTGVIIIFNLM